MIRYTVEQRMGKSRDSWEYRNAYETMNAAIQHIIDNPSKTYPHRIRRVVSTIIFWENLSPVKKSRKKNDQKED